MPALMLAISGGMFKMASIALKKVCVGLERVIDDHGREMVDVTYMTLLGHGSRRYLREDCEGSRDTKVSQNFAVLDTRKGGPPVYYLFPVNGWWSDDIDYLKTFLFEKFFRPEPTPPPDADLIAIEGFGAFRPAQLADPNHAAARRLAWPVSADALKVSHPQSAAQPRHAHTYARSCRKRPFLCATATCTLSSPECLPNRSRRQREHESCLRRCFKTSKLTESFLGRAHTAWHCHI